MNYINIFKKKIKKISIVEILFYILPLSFIAGNLVVSTNLLLFLIFSFYRIKKENLKYRFDNTSWLLLIFFSYIFILTLIQFSNYGVWIQTARDAFANEPAEKNLLPIWEMKNLTLENHPIFKSLILIRFLFLIFVIDTLFYNKILNLEKFFFSSLICTSFVSLDVIFQFIFGFDLFGLKNVGRYHSGPFGNEFIAGGYLQKFSFLSFFYIFYKCRNTNLNQPIIISFITVHSLAIMLSGNRMSLILFLFGSILLILFIKKIRFVMTSSLIIFLSLFFIIVSNNDEIKYPYRSFYYQTIHQGIVKHIIKDQNENLTSNEIEYKVGASGKTESILRTTGHARIYLTSIEMWKESHIFGFGLKSFRFKCWEILPRIEGLACANHPHNYYLELLSEFGMVGFGLMIIFFIIILTDSYIFFKKKIYRKEKNFYFLIPILLIFFLEIWPLKSTGSFFTNWAASLFWLNVALLQSNLKKKY
tara:strand:+ start:1323 stop:2747 length:1425 start_codon:yes stop_codon:yes gene_type:complete